MKRELLITLTPEQRSSLVKVQERPLAYLNDHHKLAAEYDRVEKASSKASREAERLAETDGTSAKNEVRLTAAKSQLERLPKTLFKLESQIGHIARENRPFVREAYDAVQIIVAGEFGRQLDEATALLLPYSAKPATARTLMQQSDYFLQFYGFLQGLRPDAQSPLAVEAERVLGYIEDLLADKLPWAFCK